MCQFTIPFEGSSAEIVNRANSAITNSGGSFDVESPAHGTFSIPVPLSRVDGFYDIEGQSFNITITRRGILPCSTIEREIKERISRI